MKLSVILHLCQLCARQGAFIMKRNLLLSLVLSILTTSAFALPATEQSTSAEKVSTDQGGSVFQCKDKYRFADQHHI